jgi:DNA-binding GntR family transcriptional regulator
MSVGTRSRLAPLRQEAAPLRHKIIDALRSAIESGALAPGTRLIEKDLCAQLEVSRTSLREALRQLQSDGVFEPSASRGLTVSGISREDAENAYRIRGVLEALVVEQFIERAQAVEIRQFAELGRGLKAAYQVGMPERILQAKRAFYDYICAVAENPIAFDIISRLVLRTSILRRRSVARPERQQQSFTEIDRLVKAITQRDVAAARLAAIAHVDSAARSALGPPPGAEKPVPARRAGSARPARPAATAKPRPRRTPAE